MISGGQKENRIMKIEKHTRGELQGELETINASCDRVIEILQEIKDPLALELAQTCDKTNFKLMMLIACYNIYENEEDED
jgi:hypothetical protein